MRLFGGVKSTSLKICLDVVSFVDLDITKDNSNEKNQITIIFPMQNTSFEHVLHICIFCYLLLIANMCDTVV